MREVPPADRLKMLHRHKLPIAPESSNHRNVRLYGAYRITWQTAKVAPARSAASTMSSHCSGVVAMGFPSSR